MKKIRMKKGTIWTSNMMILLICLLAVLESCDTSEAQGEEVKANLKDTSQVSDQPSEDNKPIKASMLVEDFEPTPISENITPSKATKKWTIISGIRVGDIRKNTTFQELNQSYGAGNVKKEGVLILGQNRNGGIIKGYQVRLFEGQANEALVIFSDTAAIKNPIQVKITGTKEGQWVTANNLKIGASLDDVITRNQKDFYFVGFDDNAYNGQFNGLVADWNRGKTVQSTSVRFEPSLMAKSLPVFEQFKVLTKFPTNAPDVKSLGLTVTEMSFTFL